MNSFRVSPSRGRLTEAEQRPKRSGEARERFLEILRHIEELMVAEFKRWVKRGEMMGGR